MKKLLLVTIILGAFAISCGKKEEVKTEATKTESTSTSTSSDVPKFKDPEVQKFVDNYASIINDYKKADVTKQTELMAKIQELQTQSQTVGQKLASDQDELKKYTDYIQKLVTEMQAK